MTAQTKAILKSYFNTGDIPTEAQFTDLIDSIVPGNANFVIAAVDAPALIKAQADYVCDGINDEVQIQAAIDALPATGGKVQLSSGNFSVNTGGSVTLDAITTFYCVIIRSTHPALTLEGIPGATVIQLAADQPNNPDIFHIRGSVAAPRTGPTYIYGLEIDGNRINQSVSATVSCIGANHSSGPITIDRCKIKGWKGYFGVYIYHLSQKATIIHNYFLGQGSIRLENNFFIVFNNIFEDDVAALGGNSSLSLVADYDIPDPSGGQYTHVGTTVMGNLFLYGYTQIQMLATKACLLTGNIFANQNETSGWCILLKSDSAAPGYDALYNSIVGNTFYNFFRGVAFEGDGATGVKNSILANNVFMDGPDRNILYTIYEGAGANANNMIVDNQVDPGGLATILSTGTNTVIRGNTGYVTENHGAAAAVADGGVIVHGLVATPTWVSLVASVAGEMVTATLLGAANITVAIKKHDGTPGTAQTVYWEAKV